VIWDLGFEICGLGFVVWDFGILGFWDLGFEI
jgi:hypothetical protein